MLEEYREILESLSDATTIIEFADIYDTIYVKKAALEENMAIYMAYADKCEEIKDFLDENLDIEGEIRDALYYYLTENDEPEGENTLGTYKYIVENHVATAEEIKAETERVILWQEEAVAGGYVAGSDISNLIPNYDFSKEKEGWTDAWCTGFGKVKSEDSKLNKTQGVEGWNVTGDMYQTVEGMKPGYYLVGTNGAFRPSNNRYSTNYAAGIYANGVFNYFPTVIEDYVEVNDTIDQVNCNLHGDGALDLAIYDDFLSTNADGGAELIGYAVQGPSGMAAAANAGRYLAYTIAYVGEDGKLTIGIKNPGTKYGNDWTGWSAIKVVYCGEEGQTATDALDLVLENMSARAEKILEYEYDEEEAGIAPNFPAALLDELNNAINQVTSVTSVEEQAALAASFSDIFQRIYEGKQAYIALFKAASGLASIESGNLPLVEKDIETDEWVETGEFIFGEDETYDLFEMAQDLYNAYYDGAYSAEEALNAAAQDVPKYADIIAPRDEEGFYLISTPRQLAAFRAISSFADYTVKAKMTADIDMTGIAMQPINLSDYSFRGTFDGQGHALTNVYINHGDEERTGLFNTLDGATVKNLKLTGEFYTNAKFIGAIAGYTYNNTLIENCDLAVNLYSTVNGDGTGGGLIGVNETAGTVVNNCLVNCPLFGESTDHCGGICGWATNSLTVKNTLIISQGFTVGGNESNTISRNPDNCSVSNVYYVEQLGSASGTKVTAEELASGKIAYTLNGSKSEGDLAWFQTIGVDTVPQLFNGATVYYYGGQYLNEKPNPQLNAFAYNLEANKAGSNVVVSYTLNAEAEAVEVKFYDGDELVYTAVPNDVFTAGTHKVTVPVSKLNVADATTLNYEVAVTGKGSLDILKVGESYKFNSPYGLVVNNNPASKGFGQVLVTETRPTEDKADMFSTGTPGALFAFDAAFEPVGSYYGGLDIAGETPLKLFGEYELDLKDLCFSKDGRLFVGRASGLSNSSVFEINPDNLDEAWKPVFTGGELDEETGITYVGDDEQNRMAAGLAVEGEGDDLKMYILGVQGGVEEAVPTAFNCAVYDLGTATEWSAAPSRYLASLDGAYAAIPTHIGIHADGQGGLWFIQSAGERSEEIPSIKHFNAEGNEDYSDITTNTSSGKMSLTADGKYLAIAAGSGKVVLYETNYVPMANGSIYLDPKYNVAVSESSVTGLAFDYANNLYVASSGSKTLSRYVIPSWNNSLAVTPGNGIGTSASITGDLNGDGKVDIADAVSVLNIMAAGEYNEAADLNGDQKIDIADFVSVLNIMAAQ